MLLSFCDITSWPILGPDDDAYHGKLPTRMKFVHPSAAPDLRRLLNACGWKIRISDLYRSAIDSLSARRRKGTTVGVQRPGYSAHNYGIAFDVDVFGTLKNFSLSNHTLGPDGKLPKSRLPESYEDLRAWLMSFGWTCHRPDGSRGPEEWHFNYLGMGCSPPARAAGPQKWIADRYRFDMDEKQAQEALASVKLYTGTIDGIWGSHSKAALSAFQRTYDLPADGLLDEVTERTLSIVTASVDLSPLPHDRADVLLGLPSSFPVS